ncbi:alpha/beta fold hydrolase [Cupriavidus basilensis]
MQSGYRVIRFDNRDIGKSSRQNGKPHLAWLYLRAQFGLRSRAPYSLDDMAHDTASLIDQLGLGPVHLVGASMGGMIAQIVAARFPAAVRSLTSIMSSSETLVCPRPGLTC